MSSSFQTFKVAKSGLNLEAMIQAEGDGSIPVTGSPKMAIAHLASAFLTPNVVPHAIHTNVDQTQESRVESHKATAALIEMGQVGHKTMSVEKTPNRFKQALTQKPNAPQMTTLQVEKSSQKAVQLHQVDSKMELNLGFQAAANSSQGQLMQQLTGLQPLKMASQVLTTPFEQTPHQSSYARTGVNPVHMKSPGGGFKKKLSQGKMASINDAKEAQDKNQVNLN